MEEKELFDKMSEGKNSEGNGHGDAPDGAQETELPQELSCEKWKQEDVLYEVDVHMNASVLFDFNLRHTYCSLQGPIATILGAMLLLFFAKGAGVIYLLAGIFVIAYLPWNLFLSAKRQALSTEAFQKPLHYVFTEKGIYVSQDNEIQMQRWEDVHLAVATAKSIILYTSRVKASIFPRKDLGTQTVTLIEIICKHVNPKKVRIKQ